MLGKHSWFDFLFPGFLLCLTLACTYGWAETGHVAFGVVTFVAAGETLWALWLLDWF